MKKSTIVPLIIFLVLAGGLYYVLSNAHLDVFSGTIKKHDYFTETDNMEMGKSISLLDVKNGIASLDGTGWATAVGVIGVIPFLIALLISRRIKRKERKRLAAIHANNAANETVA
jgi:ABC-type antimicrobial peptide transport system permease subunit